MVVERGIEWKGWRGEEGIGYLKGKRSVWEREMGGEVEGYLKWGGQGTR